MLPRRWSYSLISCLLIGFSSAAQVYETSFTDTNNKAVNLKPTVKLVNPTTPMSLTLISGLDRYLTVAVSNKAGSQLFNQKTSITTVNDRITASDGTEFYGKKLTLPALSDDSYVISVVVTDLKDAVVASYTYNWTIDTQPPLADPITADKGTGAANTTPGTVWKMGVASGDQFDFLSLNVSDDSGIAGATFNIYNPDGSLFSSTAMKYDQAGKKVYHTYSYHTSQGVGLPTSNLDEIFQAEVLIKDNAGNIKTLPRQQFRWDNVIGEITLFAVHDPTNNASVVPGFASNYTAYKAGMTVYENPIQFVYRIPVTNFSPDYEGGLTFYNRYSPPKQLTRANGYVYMEMKIPNGTVNVDMTKMPNFGSSFGYKPAFNVKLGGSAPATPASAGPIAEYRDELGAWWTLANMEFVSAKSLPKKFDRVRFTVSPRPFDQIASARESCTVPAGGSTCEAVATYNMTTNSQGYYRPEFAVISTEDSALRGSVFKTISWNDTQTPSITSVTLNNSTNLLTVMATLPGDSEWLESKQIVSYWLSDVSTGNKLPLTGTMLARNSGSYTFTFPISQLSEGSYNLVANVGDRYLNTVSKPYGAVVIDRTPPTATFSYENKPIAGDVTVMGLENIRITLKDNLTKPKITRVQLTGGPTSDVVDLSWTPLGNDTYSIEYPRVFPSLMNSDIYILNVTTEDEQNNAKVYSASFKYLPANLVQLQNLRTLAVNSPLKTSTDEPLAFMKTSVLRKEDGQIAKGQQTGTLTVRSDAAFPLTINGVTAAAGQTVNFSINLGKGDETLVPIYPAINGKTGTAQFILEFPQLQ
jgi:hypothetical protein